ncbi:zinc metalloprotease [Sinomicrobium kalidii]|uniref:zinc metalloprotease n=1 Tax=Sinomicrobium kalidii TaxID=2900738 RepID=UPI001E439BA7|nr:zinc metalloprotease [Sinomicrobium kalidii]UGU15413.1 zinc metalloprotease [Sinomicrobium kalidii]
MEGYEERLKTDSAFAKNEAELERAINVYLKNMQSNDFATFRSGKVVIPVVVHVVHNNTTENISDAQIQSQINALNEDYRRLNADVSSVPTGFQSVVADARIEFKLAERDPDCNPTNGITRTSTSVTSFSANPLAATPTARNPVKFASSGGVDGWPSDQYLNIWVCDLAGGLLGYASFPADLVTRPDEDGVVADYAYFGNTGTATSPFDLGRTTTHEIGHWLNLRHIWGDDQDLPDTCSGTDYVADTPNQGIYNFGCPTHPQNTCGSDDMFMNYMDYVDDACMVMFSNGQSDRMDAVLYTTRSSIVSSQGDVPPPSVTEDLYSRDMMDDVGDEPNTTSSHMYRTDDIWVRHSNDGITNQEHQNPVGGATNFVYVRVRNRGCGTASSGNVRLYWAKASSGLSWPAPWDGSVISPALMGDVIGMEPTGAVAASDYVILEYSWNTPNPADYSSFGADRTHFCLLSRIETSPTAPFGMTFPETSNLGQNVRNNNNIVWKNVSVTEPEAGGRFAATIIANYTKEPGKYKIVFKEAKNKPSLFELGKVTAVLNERLMKIWVEGGMKGEGIEPGERNEIILLRDGATLENINLRPMQLGVLSVRFEINPQQLPYARNIFELDVIQHDTDNNMFVGAQTFKVKTEN